jgi:hypothetical protein
MGNHGCAAQGTPQRGERTGTKKASQAQGRWLTFGKHYAATIGAALSRVGRQSVRSPTTRKTPTALPLASRLLC